jgi:hypothetical protein
VRSAAQGIRCADPATGAPGLYFDFCLNGQGEDVVAGRRTLTDGRRPQQLLPAVFAELQAVRAALEAEFRDVQDFEFTVQAMLGRGALIWIIPLELVFGPRACCGFGGGATALGSPGP